MEKELDVKRLLKVQPENGIFLNEQRIFLMDSASLGMLRRDLIKALGVDRTKGFLLRYGWNCGSEYAKHLKSAFPIKTELDWLNFGPQIHEITGTALVDLINMKYDPENREFYSEGYWHQSYEADQHIKHFGYYHEAICYTLCGFAGGYVSSHLGRKIIFKEVECIGKGDDCCHWIAKPVEDWGPDIESELDFYEEENLGRELDNAYMRIENQKEMFKRVLKINEELSKVILRREGLLSIISTLGKHLNVTVTIEDIDFNLMEVYGQYKHHQLSNFIQNHKEKDRSKIGTLLSSKLTVHLSIPEQFGWKHERLISPIIVNKEVLGYISLLKEHGSFNEMETISLERTSTISAIQLLNERINIEREQKIKGDFLDELLSGNQKGDDLTYRMKLFGHNPSQPHYVFVFNLEHKDIPKKDKEAYLAETKNELVDFIHKTIKDIGQNCLVSSKLDQIIGLVPLEMIEKLNLGVEGFGKLLMGNLQKQFKQIDIMLGISSLCSFVNDYKKGYEEAKKVIEIAQMKKETEDVISYERLGLIAKLCSSHQNINSLRNYAMEWLGVLKEYDEKNSTELLKTLYYYLDNQNNILETARSMLLSPGAIKYRLKRIQEISPINLKRTKDIYESYDALQILLFLGEIKVTK